MCNSKRAPVWMGDEPLCFISTMNVGQYGQEVKRFQDDHKHPKQKPILINSQVLIFLIYSPLPSRISALSTGLPSTRPSPFRRPLTYGNPPKSHQNLI
ncbi:hypothetical protein KVT40_001615 [Elsinoe batatas]|uniref:Uncharacterized protein n=1 Tax=Elsinoe batatas TaxID=2601811 RepID=A0A8K0L501_9PEZI|nr:hypothetical protein KVT40_001615 [Elsinoe batatas]